MTTGPISEFNKHCAHLCFAQRRCATGGKSRLKLRYQFQEVLCLEPRSLVVVVGCYHEAQFVDPMPTMMTPLPLRTPPCRRTLSAQFSSVSMSPLAEYSRVFESPYRSVLGDAFQGPSIESAVLLLINKLQGDSHPASPAAASGRP
jgi:hypothetical protein